MTRKNRNARKRAIPMPVEELVAPTPEQVAKGYSPGFVMDDNGLKAWAYRNTNHDPVERWLDNERIDQRQKSAIDLVRRLWNIVGIRQNVTANYGERIGGTGSVEHNTAMYLDAKDDLKRIEGYFAGLDAYWQCFVNVCRFGQSAGVAGCELGFGSRSSEVRAHQIVCFIADFIASKERL